jgi:hypothetical protein
MTRRGFFAAIVGALAALAAARLPNPRPDPPPTPDDAAYVASLRRVLRVKG